MAIYHTLMECEYCFAEALYAPANKKGGSKAASYLAKYCLLYRTSRTEHVLALVHIKLLQLVTSGT